MYNYYGYYYMIKYGHLDDVTMIVRWMTPLHCLIVNSDNNVIPRWQLRGRNRTDPRIRLAV
jgi:hypothetical protein